MDILYTLKQCDQCDELIYSLRSLSNVPHDKVFLVGGCPSWVDKSKVIHIPTEQKGTKWHNSTNNVKAACLDARLSDDFILMNDDFFILKPIQDPAKEFNLQQGTIKSVYAYYFGRNAGQTNWCKGMRETGELMQKQGILEPLSYDLHTPMVFNKNKFLQMFDIAGVNDIAVLHWRSLYGNLFLPNAEYMKDIKYRTNEAFDESKYDKFISCSNAGFLQIRQFLSNKFPNRSIYEKERI